MKFEYKFFSLWCSVKYDHLTYKIYLSVSLEYIEVNSYDQFFKSKLQKKKKIIKSIIISKVNLIGWIDLIVERQWSKPFGDMVWQVLQ